MESSGDVGCVTAWMSQRCTSSIGEGGDTTAVESPAAVRPCSAGPAHGEGGPAPRSPCMYGAGGTASTEQVLAGTAECGSALNLKVGQLQDDGSPHEGLKSIRNSYIAVGRAQGNPTATPVARPGDEQPEAAWGPLGARREQGPRLEGAVQRTDFTLQLTLCVRRGAQGSTCTNGASSTGVTSALGATAWSYRAGLTGRGG